MKSECIVCENVFFLSPPSPRLFIIFSYTVNFLKKYFQKLSIELLRLESRMRLFLFIEKYFSLHFSSFLYKYHLYANSFRNTF